MVKKPKRKLTAAERRKRKEFRATHRLVFINGKQKWQRLPPTIDGVDAELYFLQNATPIELHLAGRWDLLYEREQMEAMSSGRAAARPGAQRNADEDESRPGAWHDEIPF